MCVLLLERHGLADVEKICNLVGEAMQVGKAKRLAGQQVVEGVGRARPGPEVQQAFEGAPRTGSP